MAQMKASILIDLVDRATKPLKSLSRAVGATSKAAGKAGAQGAVATKKLSGMNSVLGGLAKKLGSSRNGADRLGRELRGLSSETRDAAGGTARLVEWQDRLGRAAGRAREQLYRTGRALDRQLTRQARRPRATAGGFGRGVLGGVAGSALFAGSRAALRLPGGFVETAARFETLETTLGTLQRSSEKAKESMKWVRGFTSRTPYELDQVAESFVKLKVFGLDPTGGLLRDIGDTASAMDKSVLDGVEAIGDALRGENERLKEFSGIVGSLSGDTITYSWRDLDTQRDRTATVRKGDTDQIVRTLRDIMAGNYGGTMADKMATYDGMMSNLRDKWTEFKYEVMAAGPFEMLKGYLQGALDKINAMAESGELADMASLWGERFKHVMGVLKDEVWPVLRDDIWPAMKDIGGVMLDLFKIANKIAGAIGGWGVALKGLVGLGFLKLGGWIAGGMVRTVAGPYESARKGLEWLDKKRKGERAQALRQRGGRIAKAARGLASRGLDAAAPLASGAKNMAKSGWGKLSGWLLRIGRVVAPFAMVALKGLGAVLASVAGVISGPVLAAAAAIGIAGVLIWKNWEPIKGFFGKLWDGVKKAFSGAWKWISEIDWGGLGMRLLETLAAGIKGAAGLPFKALEFALGKLRDLLPGSDARAGPLSRLTASGMAILPTMGEGVRRSGAGPLQRPLARALGTAAAGLALSAPAPAFQIAPGAPAPASEPARPGVTRVVHHHYRITIQQQPGEDSSELADRLIRELENRQALAGREALGDAY